MARSNFDRFLLFKYASRGRPELFERGLKSICQNTLSPWYSVLCSVDEDDPCLESYRAVVDGFASPNIDLRVGRSTSKIDAINRDLPMAREPWDILVNMSDDMVFLNRGFDDAIRFAFSQSLDLFVHFNDGNQGAKLCTMSILGRAYFNRFGYIYHPSYRTLFCDNEAQDVAKSLGKYLYMGDSLRIFDHLHPDFGLAERDQRYRESNDALYAELDQENYERRKAAGFPAEID